MKFDKKFYNWTILLRDQLYYDLENEGEEGGFLKHCISRQIEKIEADLFEYNRLYGIGCPICGSDHYYSDEDETCDKCKENAEIEQDKLVYEKT